MCLATILNGILWILQSGAPWRDLPKSFAPELNRRTPHRRF
jgi:transposase